MTEYKTFDGKGYMLTKLYPRTKTGEYQAKYMQASMKVVGANARLVYRGHYIRLYVSLEPPKRVVRQSKEFWAEARKRGVIE